MAISKSKTKAGDDRFKVTLWQNNKVVACRTFLRKRDAAEWENRQRLKSADSKVGRLPGRSMTFEEFFQNHFSKNSGVRASTWSDYERIYHRHLRDVLGKRMISEITSVDFNNLFHDLKINGMSDMRINRIQSAASAMLSKAVKWKIVSENPILRISYRQEPLTVTEHWSLEETDTFLNFTRRHCGERYFLYHLIYSTGLRISEAIELQWDCIDFENDILEVRRSFSKITKTSDDLTKSNKVRRIGVNGALRVTLLTLFNNRRSQFVFSEEDGSRLEYDRILRRFRKDQMAAAVKPLGLHGLRHSYASHFVMKGGQIIELKAILGHSDIATSERYVHLTPDYLKNKSKVVEWSPKALSDFEQVETAKLFPNFEKQKICENLVESSDEHKKHSEVKYLAFREK